MKALLKDMKLWVPHLGTGVPFSSYNKSACRLSFMDEKYIVNLNMDEDCLLCPNGELMPLDFTLCDVEGNEIPFTTFGIRAEGIIDIFYGDNIKGYSYKMYKISDVYVSGLTFSIE